MNNQNLGNNNPQFEEFLENLHSLNDKELQNIYGDSSSPENLDSLTDKELQSISGGGVLESLESTLESTVGKIL